MIDQIFVGDIFNKWVLCNKWTSLHGENRCMTMRRKHEPKHLTVITQSQARHKPEEFRLLKSHFTYAGRKLERVFSLAQHKRFPVFSCGRIFSSPLPIIPQILDFQAQGTTVTPYGSSRTPPRKIA